MAAKEAMVVLTIESKEIKEGPPFRMESINNETRGMENPGERSLIVQTGLRSHINNLLREQPTPPQFAEGFKILADEYYSK